MTSEPNNNKKPWLFYVIFLVAFIAACGIFLRYINYKIDHKIGLLIPTKAVATLSKETAIQETSAPAPENQASEEKQETQEPQTEPEQPEEKSIKKLKPAFDKPNPYKGQKYHTENNLDYESLTPSDITTGFKELIGYSEVKPKIEPLLKILENYQNNLKNKTVIPHGLLLYGPSQEDMTKLALSIGKTWAQEIYVINGQDVGNDNVGRTRIRELYANSMNVAPFVLVIKNIEFVLPATIPPSTLYIDYEESMGRFYKWFEDLNDNNQPVLIIGTTNDLYNVAPSAFKLGRFDYSVAVDEPNLQDRQQILEEDFSQLKIKKADPKALAEKTEGFSRKEIEGLINQSKLDASVNNRPVNEQDLTSALKEVNHQRNEYEDYAKTSALNKDFQLITPNDIATRFSDIAGLEDVKNDFKDVLDALHNPEKYTSIGAYPPRGILLYGPPGTGKTTMARALAGEGKVNFINVSGSEFVEEFVGMGASRVRKLFNMARRNAPCIIFIDEFDALAIKRGSDEGGGHERAQTVNQLLFEMDNLDKARNANVFVMAATNNISLIDKAVLRPGRFDKKIFFRLPNDNERKNIIHHMIKTKNFKPDFDVERLAKDTKGFSIADLNSLINQGLLAAAKANSKVLTQEDIDSVRNSVGQEMMAIAKQDIELDLEIFRPSQIKGSFKSIAGLEDVKAELSQMISFLKDPEKAQKMGVNIAKGWIFHGPPGTGKTSLARAVAGESGVTFISTNGSAFVEKYVGQGAQRVRQLFEVARQYAPAIVFIDEIDAVATKRSAGGDGANQEYASTTNQLLTELDNVNKERNADIVVIGATNRLDRLDEALLRPGRLGKSIYVRLPNLAEREEIFKIYLAKINIENDVEVKKLASTTGGFSGADIENLVNEAALIAVGNNKPKANMADFENAKDIILLGRESTSNVMPEEREATAYHEAGHALVGILSKNYPLKFYKITIGVRDETLGVTFFEEDIERYSQSREALMDIVATKLAGKMAEELVYGKDMVSSGPSMDLKQATILAQKMVTEYGMGSDGLFIAYEYLDSPPNDLIYKQIETIIKEGTARAEKILTENREKLNALAKELIKNETLSHDQVMKIINSH